MKCNEEAEDGQGITESPWVNAADGFPHSQLPGAFERLDLSFIMPAFDEEAVLEAALERTIEILRSLDGLSFELILVNDGSRDRTPEIARRVFAGVSFARVVDHERNLGLGAAVRTGILNSFGERIVFMPVDSPLEKHEIERYLAAFDDKTEIVVGCRISRLGYNPLMRFNSVLYPALVRILFGVKLRDFNWIHMYRRRIFPRAINRNDGIFGPTEIILKAVRMGCRIREIDVGMKERKVGSASASRFRVMLRTLRELLLYRLRIGA
jgi:glycosyltransferase involved in cell wall biosynthesis